MKFLLYLDQDEMEYAPLLKPLIEGRAVVKVMTGAISSAFEVLGKAKGMTADGIITSSPYLLNKILGAGGEKQLSINNYAGSLVQWKGIEVLFIPPIKQLATTTTGKFITKRFLDKFLSPGKYISAPEFAWELFDPGRVEEYLEYFSSVSFIAVDIETFRGDPERKIECISFTGVELFDVKVILRTLVVPFNDMFTIIFCRRLLRNKIPKAFQNGKYDIAYLFRFNCPVTNYLLDTVNLFHCWLSELPKDLGFISAFMVRNYLYHKDDGSEEHRYARFAYNAKDTYYTALAVIALLVEAPDYLWGNYFQEFPVVFPCILCEHTGLKWDGDRAAILEQQSKDILFRELRGLQRVVGNLNFNPSSYKQVLSLFAILGSKDVKTTQEKNLLKVASRHPLNKKIISRIITYRENSKKLGSYFKEGVSWNGRVFYALNPHGTDTGRLASKESQFWCGFQIQNIPVDEQGKVSIKEAFVADDGFLFCEADYSQNEARGTGYLSGDTALIEAVEDKSKDFHGLNASKFFGVPYESIVLSTCNEQGEWKHKVINKPLRNKSKRTNHGANYNMGDAVLLDTMGVEEVFEAKKLLGLPPKWSLRQTTQYLLDCFDRTYRIIRDKGPKGWYGKIIKDVLSTGFLVGPTGWTRRCFGNPEKNKLDLNSYAAHPPQSLAAMLLNKAFLRVFQEIWLPNAKLFIEGSQPEVFKMHAQIHDSLFNSYRKGWEHLARDVEKCMDNPQRVMDGFGVCRTLSVPVDVKLNGERWSDLS